MGIELAFNTNVPHQFNAQQSILVPFNPVGGPTYALQLGNYGASDSGRFALDAQMLVEGTSGTNTNPNAAVRALLTKGPVGGGEGSQGNLDAAILAKVINPIGWLGWNKVDGIRVEMADQANNCLEMNGVEIASVTGATLAAVTAIKIADQTSGATNFAIKTGLGRVSFGDLVDFPIYAVAGLPAGTVRQRAFVNNALGPVWGATVIGGGGVTVPVYFDGASWKVG